jgi:hypothetical protein
MNAIKHKLVLTHIATIAPKNIKNQSKISPIRAIFVE